MVLVDSGCDRHRPSAGSCTVIGSGLELVGSLKSHVFRVCSFQRLLSLVYTEYTRLAQNVRNVCATILLISVCPNMSPLRGPWLSSAPSEDPFLHLFISILQCWRIDLRMLSTIVAYVTCLLFFHDFFGAVFKATFTGGQRGITNFVTFSLFSTEQKLLYG